MVGGLVALFASWYVKRNKSKARPDHASALARSERAGLLFASGLITGEALVGILLALPIVIWERNIFDLHSQLPAIVGFIALVGVCYWLYRSTAKSYSE
jgi:hypothetical protein